MRKHTYVSAERFILSREFFGLKLGLRNISEFLQSIGAPQTRYKTIHLAGTNGKGSTAAMLAAILQAQGYKTGLFTSPHLVSLRERISVNGRRISQRSVVSFIDANRPELSRRKLSFFELLAAMAFDYFRRARVDVAVIETGLGGRLDATNVLRPELTLTTEISRDHLEILGRSLTRIAREKAGIIKPAVPHLVGLLPGEAEEVIRGVCREKRAPFHRLSARDMRLYPGEMKFDFKYDGARCTGISTSLKGVHQMRNAALALKASAILSKNGLPVTRRAMREGLARTRWPGRFQIIGGRRRPIVILDVAHNESGVRSFVETFTALYPGRQADVISGFVKRKEHQKMFDALSVIARGYALVPLKTRRTTDLDELIGAVNWRGREFRRFGSLPSAYAKLLKSADPDDIIIVIGSHYLVGEFIDKIGLK